MFGFIAWSLITIRCFDVTTDTPTIDVRLLDGPVAFVATDSFPEACGGECVFLGRTRQETSPEHGPLIRLSYEAYAPMAEKVLRSLAEDAVRLFGCHVVRIHHAVGDVPTGEASVLVQVACGHRGEAFDACRMLIDRLKAEAPIWKQEQWADGTTWSKGKPVSVQTGAPGARP